MKTPNPTVILSGSLFELDFSSRAFTQRNGSKNSISFDRLESHGDYYLLNYNPERKQAASAISIRDNSAQLKTILIDKQILTSPASTLESPDYCKSHNQQSYQRDLGILLLDQDIKDRLMGKLPVIDIAGHPFYVDLRMGALRPHDDFINRLEFKDMYQYKKQEFQFFYEPASHKQVKLRADISEYPKGILGVYLPSQKQLDPVSYARLSGAEETSLLPQYPQKQSLTATIKPLSKTWLAAQVKQNQLKAAEKPLQNQTIKLKRKKANRL